MEQELYKFDIKKDVVKSVVMVIYALVVASLLISAMLTSHGNVVGSSIFIALSVVLTAASTYKKVSVYSPNNKTVTVSKLYFNKALFTDTIKLDGNSRLRIFDENVRSGNSPAQNIGNKAGSSINIRNSFLTLTISDSNDKELQLFSDHRPEKQEGLLESANKISKILGIDLIETEERKYK